MNCPDRNVLLAFQTGELSETTAEEVISHISVCSDCQTTLHAFGDAEDTLVAKLRNPAVEDPYKDEPQQAELMARAMALVVGGLPISAETLAPADLGRLGEYQLLAKLGEGGMGAVYKARQTRLKKIVALKVLPKERTADPRAVTRFEREMEAVGQLSHPNIVQAYDARDIDATTVLVMEYVDGKDLGELLKCVKSLRIADACEVVRQTALGLQYAHEHGMVHRDIKPSNLMLASGAGCQPAIQAGPQTSAGWQPAPLVKILDLGLALLSTDKPGQGELTSTGAAMGTADYMAPEQVSDAHAVDIRADIYGLGCTLYKLLTGQAPFSGPQYKTPAEKLVGHLKETPPPVQLLRTDMPPELVAVIERMMAKRPDDRFATPAEVAAAIAPFAAGCDLARVSAAAADGVAAREQSSVGTDPHVSSGVVGTDSGRKLPSPVLGRGAGGEGGRHRHRFGVKGIIAIALGLSAVVLLGVLIKMRTSEGTLIVEVDDDPGAIVQVLNDKNEIVIERKGEKGSVTIGVAPGKGRLRLVKDGVELFAQDFSLVSGGKETIRATLEPNAITQNSNADLKSQISDFKSPLPAIGSLIGPDGKWKLPPGAPPPAIAPFDAKQAKEHQAAWAKYLGVPVEITNSIGMKLMLIPPGEFMMGSPKELVDEELKAHGDDQWYADRLPTEAPRHHVRITRPFYMGRHMVTQEEYQWVMGANPSEFSATGKSKDKIAGQDTKRFPVDNVSWDDAVEFCNRLTEITTEKVANRQYRLPTEAQWEDASRTGSAGRFSFSSGSGTNLVGAEEQELFDYAWLVNNSRGRPHAVDGRLASPWGIHDIYGNMEEWCQDWFNKDYYAKAPVNDPAGPPEGSGRVLRGGSWLHYAWQCRSAFRTMEGPGIRWRDIGFRVSLVFPEKPIEPTTVPDEPIVRPTPVHLDLKPDAKAWDLKPGSPLNPASLVLKPAAIKGLRSWTLETCASLEGWEATGQLSPDDKLYATGDFDGVIRFLDPTNGKLRIALVNPELEIRAITWSPDSAYVAVGSMNGAVRIWNVANGILVISPPCSSTNAIRMLAWSPDGMFLAIARWGESSVDLWNVREARQLAVLQEPADVNRPVFFLAWSADGKQLMVTTHLAVRIWDVAGARLVRTLDSQSAEDQVGRCAAAWSPDGKRIATLCDNGKVKFFDSTYSLVVSGEIGGPVWLRTCMAWSPDGLHLAGGHFSGCQVLNTHTGLQEFGIDGLEFSDESSGLSWLQDSTGLLCTHMGSGIVIAMDAHSGKPLWKVAGRHVNDGTNIGISLCVSPDGRQYATAPCRDHLYTWDVMQGAPAQDFGSIFSSHVQVAWSNDGRLAVAGGSWWSENDGGRRIWNPRKPGESHLYHDGGCRCAAWSPDGKTLARGGRDVLISTSDSEDPRRVFHRDSGVARLAWGTNNSTLAAGLDNNKVVILEMPSGKVLRTLEREGLDGGIRYLVVLTDGRLVAASQNGFISVWNSKWETVGEIVPLGIDVRDGAMPAGGTAIAFATSDGIVLWDADKQAVQGKIGTGPTYSVAWSLPLHRLFAAQQDRLAIYDDPSGELLGSQVIWYGPGKHLFLSPEGHMRCSPAMSEDVVYVALTDDGRQVTLRPAEFEAKYEWKNDPQKIRLSSAAPADKPSGSKVEKPK